MKTEKATIKALNDGLCDPSKLMESLYFNTKDVLTYQLIFLMGVRVYLIRALNNEDGSFSEETLTIKMNVDLIREYIKYSQQLGAKIDDLFASQIASQIHFHWRNVSNVSLLLIKSQVEEIAKPFYQSK